MAKRTYNIASLQRGLRILRIFGETPHGLTAKQLSQKSRLPESTVHRFLTNLQASGFLTCGPDGVYELGIACLAIGNSALSQLDIRHVSLPFLRQLNLQTRETVHLTVRHGSAAVYVEKLESPEPLRIHSRIGSSVPLFCTAVGKLLLAYAPEEERRLSLHQMQIKRLTPNTAGSIQELEADLLRIRKVGYACDMEEHELHIRCIAAPVWDYTGNVCASLSVTAPAVRMHVLRMRQIAPMVVTAGLQISHELGYRMVGVPSEHQSLQSSVLAQVMHSTRLVAKSQAL